MAVIKQRSQSAGLPPGPLVYIGDQPTGEFRIDSIDYTDTEVQEDTVESPADCEVYLARDSLTWINIIGLGNIPLLESIGDAQHIAAEQK